MKHLRNLLFLVLALASPVNAQDTLVSLPWAPAVAGDFQPLPGGGWAGTLKSIRRDVPGGYSADSITVGDLFVDAAARLYEVTSVTTRGLDTVTVDVVGLAVKPTGRGGVFHPDAFGFVAVPTGGTAGASDYLIARIQRHNQRIAARSLDSIATTPVAPPLAVTGDTIVGTVLTTVIDPATGDTVAAWRTASTYDDAELRDSLTAHRQDIDAEDYTHSAQFVGSGADAYGDARTIGFIRKSGETYDVSVPDRGMEYAGGWDADGERVTNVQDPADDGDAANRSFVEAGDAAGLAAAESYADANDDVDDADNDPTNELYDDAEVRDSLAAHRTDIDVLRSSPPPTLQTVTEAGAVTDQTVRLEGAVVVTGQSIFTGRATMQDVQIAGGRLTNDYDAAFHRIYNLLTPTNGGDAANKAYVDARIVDGEAGGEAYADSVALDAQNNAQAYADANDDVDDADAVVGNEVPVVAANSYLHRRALSLDLYPGTSTAPVNAAWARAFQLSDGENAAERAVYGAFGNGQGGIVYSYMGTSTTDLGHTSLTTFRAYPTGPQWGDNIIYHSGNLPAPHWTRTGARYYLPAVGSKVGVGIEPTNNFSMFDLRASGSSNGSGSYPGMTFSSAQFDGRFGTVHPSGSVFAFVQAYSSQGGISMRGFNYSDRAAFRLQGFTDSAPRSGEAAVMLEGYKKSGSGGVLNATYMTGTDRVLLIRAASTLAEFRADRTGTLGAFSYNFATNGTDGQVLGFTGGVLRPITLTAKTLDNVLTAGNTTTQSATLGGLTVTGATDLFGADMGGGKITSVASPAVATDAANKAYVDAAITAAAPARFMEILEVDKTVDNNTVTLFTVTGLPMPGWYSFE